MRLWRVLGDVAMLGMASSGLAAPNVFAPVPGAEYSEHVDAPLPVSGLALVGLALAGEFDPDAKVLHVYLAQPFSGRLRLEITTADGRFRAQAVYEGRSGGDEWVALSIDPGDSSRKARQHLIDHPTPVAVSVRPVTDGRTATDSIFQASWGILPGATDERVLRLHVNSRRADMYVRAPGAKAVPCKSLRIAAAVRFDTLCELTWRPSAARSGQAALPQLELVRRDGFDESQQRVTLR
jgi:hypothetical protein